MLNAILDFVRGVVRPTVTWGGFFALVWMVTHQMPVPEWFSAMVGGLLGYWFAERNGGHNGGQKPPNNGGTL